MKDAIPLPAFTDNYIWAWHRDGAAAVVDPGDAEVVHRWLAAENLHLSDILLTHWHPDHTGGVAALMAETGARVSGPAAEADRIPPMDRQLVDGDSLEVLGESFRVMSVPGHTLGHIAFVGKDCVFCGDTLFHMGCGRLFEGSPEQMHRSLAALAALSPDSLVYCTHEYTLANLDFARRIEPENPRLAAVEAAARAARADNRPTLPTTIGEQRAANPFLRSEDPELAEAVSRQAGEALAPGLPTFAALRALKDRH
jgi:hydroxyacylglutathione hydrolase